MITTKRSGSWPLPEVLPADVGMCPKRLERVGELVSRLVEERTIAGALTLAVRRGGIAHLRCFGMRDVARKAPMTDDALFRLYSMTKPITCVATLMLYEGCAFTLQDPVSRFLPEFAGVSVAVKRPDGGVDLVPPRRPVTIHDLLSHTGGLTYDLAQDPRALGMDNAAFVRAFCEMPLAHHPGETWRYSASNDVLGRLIEVVSGQPLDAFFAERIFAPLGMADTGFFVPPAKRDRLAELYEHDEHGRIVRRQAEDRPYLERPTFLSGGAGLVGSAPDYLRFCLMLLAGGELDGTRLLSRKTVELMRQDHLPPGHPAIEPYKFGYGYGVSVVRSLAEKQGITSVGEFGWGGAACTNAWIDPVEQMISMVMVQLRPSKVPMIDHRVKVALTQAIAD
jgi:CubicO group peptidase (beta-lactamase class C family)